VNPLQQAAHVIVQHSLSVKGNRSFHLFGTEHKNKIAAIFASLHERFHEQQPQPRCTAAIKAPLRPGRVRRRMGLFH